MTLVTTTPRGRALVLNALRRAREWRALEIRRRDVARVLPLEVACAWCGETIREGWRTGAGRVSHGICQSCEQEMEP